MDQGKIQNLKIHYRRFLLDEGIKAIDEEIYFRFNLLNALHLLRKAWSELTPTTISNCFKKATFVILNEISENEEPIDETEIFSIVRLEIVVREIMIKALLTPNGASHS